MKTKLMALALLAGGAMFAQPRVSIGIGIGGYAPQAYAPVPVASYMPPCPGPNYDWVDGYWSADRGRNVWVSGFWQPLRFGQARHDNRYYQERWRAEQARYRSGYRDNDRYRDNERYRDNDRRRDNDHDRSNHFGQRNR